MVTAVEKATWNNKQNAISDLDDIRSGAAKGATALQSYTETDPTVPTHVKAITVADISSWNNKQPAGDYATNTALTNGLASKANKATTLVGYGITDAFTKEEVNTELGKKADKATTYSKTEVDNAINSLQMIKWVDILPETGESKYIYAIPREETDTDGKQIAALYLWDGSAWRGAGAFSLNIDPDTLATKTEVEAKQDKLIAGTNITIEGNVISATGGSGSGFDFEGTKAEFDAAVAAGTISISSAPNRLSLL